MLKVLKDNADGILDFFIITMTLGIVAKGLLLIGFVFFGDGAW